MKAFNDYWSFNAIRGALTLIAAIAIVAIPRAAADEFAIPIMIALSIACYATYTIFDGVVMVLLGKLLPAEARGRCALYAQAAMAVVLCALIFLTGYHILSLTWLAWLASAHAAIAALTECFIARGTHREYGCASCYSSVFVLAFAAVALPFIAGLNPASMSLALGAYLAAFGLSELSLGGRMLFVEYRQTHPAKPWLSEAWKLSIEPATPPATAANFANCLQLTCNSCPADAVCRDNSLQGKLTTIFNNRQPAIVNTMRAATLLHQH